MFKMLLQLLILGMCYSGSAASGTEKLRVATEGAYPPFNFINEQGQVAGFDIDIAQELCRRLEKECEIITVPWKELLPGLNAGKYDVVIASMSKTPEREQQVEFTDSYYRTRNVFIGRPQKGISNITPETARGKVLATQDGTVQSEYLNRHYQGVATLKLMDTFIKAFAMLASGEADVVFADSLTAFEFLRSDAGQGFDIIGEPIGTINPASESAYLQVRKGNVRLRDSINAALRSLWLDGTHHKINARYFPFDIY